MSVVPIANEYVAIGKIVVVSDGTECWVTRICDAANGAQSNGYYAEFYETKEEAEEAARSWQMPIRYDHAISTMVESPHIEAPTQ